MKRFILSIVGALAAVFMVGCGDNAAQPSLKKYVLENADIAFLAVGDVAASKKIETIWEDAFRAVGLEEFTNGQESAAKLKAEQPEFFAIIKALTGADDNLENGTATACVASFVLPTDGKMETLAYILVLETPTVDIATIDTQVLALLTKYPDETAQMTFTKDGAWSILKSTVGSLEFAYSKVPEGYVLTFGQNKDVRTMVEAMASGRAPKLDASNPLMAIFDDDLVGKPSAMRLVVKDLSAIITRNMGNHEQIPPAVLMTQEVQLTTLIDGDDGDVSIDLNAQIADPALAKQTAEMLVGFKAMAQLYLKDNPVMAQFLPMINKIECEADETQLAIDLEVTPAEMAQLVKVANDMAEMNMAMMGESVDTLDASEETQVEEIESVEIPANIN